MRKSKPRLAFIGAGKVGKAMARLLHLAGFPVAGVSCRSRAAARRAVQFIGGGRAALRPATAARAADVIFLTVPDRAIKPVCAEISSERAFRKGAFVFHCSGSLSSDVLKPAGKCGAHVASLHPLQTFASAEHAVKALPGSYFGFEGEAEAVEVASEIVAALKGKMVHVGKNLKPLYHAASVAASNYLVATTAMGVELAELAGVGKDVALKALLPLIEGTVKNIRSLGLTNALTGPVVRGDAATVAEHIDAMKELAPDLLAAYKALGRLALRLAREKGALTPAQARRLSRLLRES